MSHLAPEKVRQLANLAGGTDKLPFFSGADALSQTDLTALARTVVGRATAALMRSDLGLDTGNSPTFTDLTVSGNFTVQGSRTVIGGEKTALADNYLDLNANYTADAAQSSGIVFSYDPTATTNAVAAGGFVAGVASTSNPTVEVTAAVAFAAGDVIRVQGSTTNDGFYEVQAALATPTRVQIKGIGTVGAVEDWSGNQFTTEAGVGNLFKVNVAVLRVGTDGVFEVGKGSAVPLVYADLPSDGPALVGAVTTVDAGSVAGAGTAVTWARGDHEHAVTSGAAVGLDANTSNAEGAGSALARAGHTHAVASAAPGAVGVATAPGVGVSASFARADHTHQANSAPLNVTKAVAAIGVSGEPARADHKHDVTTAAPPRLGGSASALEGTTTSLARADHDHGTDPTADGQNWGSLSLRWDVYSRERVVFGQEKGVNYTIAAGDDLIVTTSAVTITLPDITTVEVGRAVRVKNVAATATTVARTGTDTIDGATSRSLGQYASEVYCRRTTGTDWMVL